jgi:metallo-beta-lactamase class B
MLNTRLLRPFLCLAASTTLSLLQAQAPNSAPANMDKLEVRALIAKAKKAAGTEWAGAERFLCEEPRGASANDPLVEPTKIFDNVYLLGKDGGEIYAITSSEGIILLGSGAATETESVLLAGLQKLGLDPSKIKAVVIAHGHADHFGGAKFLQEKYGAHVYISAQDWDLMEHPPAVRGGEKKKGAAPVLPNHDMLLTEGQPVVVGDAKVTPIFIPGHTPGSMALMFSVKDNGKTHSAAIFGGAVLLVRAMSGDSDQYLKSIERFRDAAKKAKVDVYLKDHPLFDGEAEKLAKLRSRKKGEPNPFVVGQASYMRYIDVMSACFEAQIEANK